LNLKLDRELVIFDTETTGLDPKNDRIIQFGAVKVHPDGRTKEWETLINPTIPISLKASQTHGISNAMVIGKPTFKEIGPVIADAIINCDLCGYNVLFDIRFLKAEFARIERRLEPCDVIDPLRIFQAEDSRDHKLVTAVKYYLEKDHTGAHTALADAKATFEVLEKQLERNPNLPRTPKELYKLCFKTTPKGFVDKQRKLMIDGDDIIINFGKHKGTSIKLVPKQYLHWILEGDFSNIIKDTIRKALQ
jgi:DNA polymerase-3 subunit epsilon